MHYYQHHIGDFIKATARLSDSQTMAYLRLLWMYYDSEKPLKPDIKILAFQIGASLEDTELLLNSYFILCENGWHQKRCDIEISEYRELLNKKSNAGKASAEQRKNRRLTDVEQLFNSSGTNEQLTNNQEPITNNHKSKKEKATVVATPDGVSQSVWDDFKTLRKAKKAPITQRAVDGIIVEANKAGWSLEQALTECVVRGWQSFKADWITDKSKVVNRFDVATITVPSKPGRDPALVKLDQDRLKVVPPSPEILAKLQTLKVKT